jgi:Capsule polysaccharide biosynthesis protein.
MLDAVRPDLVVISHVSNVSFAAIACAAIRRNIPVVLICGNYGFNRFVRLSQPADIFSEPDRPTPQDDAALDQSVAARLRSAGAAYLADRLGGRTDDVGAIYAFRRRSATINRKDLATRYNWDPKLPIMGIYAPTWFDFPNSAGNLPFRDFREWLDVTLAAARDTQGINFLFKAHPGEEWYGINNGPRVADLVASVKSSNCMLADASWNGLDLLNCIDGVVTVHGTVGIEAAALGRPVLVPYACWYGDYGIGRVASSREDYIGLLQRAWWTDVDTEAGRVCAEKFAGWYFCVPDWHDDFFLEDDANQDAIWRELPLFLRSTETKLCREVDEIRAWVADGQRYFHTFKMRRASGFMPAHPRSSGETADDPRKRQLMPVDRD